MLVTLMKAKLHRATVTQADMDYEGSIAIDRDLLDASGILPHEQVDVLNITTGARFTTYAIRASALTFAQLLAETLKGRPGTFDVGELAILEQAGNRAVPTSLFTRWVSS